MTFHDIRNATGPVTVPAGDYGGQVVDLAGVKVPSIVLSGAQNLTLRGLEVSSATGGPLVYAKGCSGLNFEAFHVHGENRTGVGFSFRDCSGVKVVGCRVENVGNGISHLGLKDSTFEGNAISQLQSDGISGGDSGPNGVCERIRIAGNLLTDFKPKPGDHPDAIQLWANGSGFVIENNTIIRGPGEPMQGVFVEWSRGLTIRGNVCFGTMFNGISLSGVKGARVEGNLVQGLPDMPTRIIVRGASSGVTIVGNAAQQVVQIEDKGVNPDLMMSDNDPADLVTLFCAVRDGLSLAQATRKARAKNAGLDRIISVLA